MDENIDVRMANYLSILGNPEMSKNFYPSVIRDLERAVAIYAATTSKEYLQEYKKEQENQELLAKFEDVSRMMR